MYLYLLAMNNWKLFFLFLKINCWEKMECGTNLFQQRIKVTTLFLWLLQSALANICFWKAYLISDSQLSFTTLATKTSSPLKSQRLKSQRTLNYSWHHLRHPVPLIPVGEQTQQLVLKQLMNCRNASGCSLCCAAVWREDLNLYQIKVCLCTNILILLWECHFWGSCMVRKR